MAIVGTLRLGLVLLVGEGITAPPADGAPDPTADAAPVADEPAVEAKRLFAEGSSKFDLGDCNGAIAAWEQAYELLPPNRRGQLQVPLGNAHVCAYEADDDPEHLRRAAALFRDYLAALDAADEGTRAEVAALLAAVEDALAEVEAEAEQREQEMVEREAAARERAAEAIVTQQLQDLDPWTDEERRRFRLYNAVGGSLLGVGAVGLGLMATAMVLGQNVDVRGDELTAADPYSTYAELHQEGRRWNAVAATAGAIGGAAVISGATLLIVSAVQRERARRKLDESARARPRIVGLELRF